MKPTLASIAAIGMLSASALQAQTQDSLKQDVVRFRKTMAEMNAVAHMRSVDKEVFKYYLCPQFRCQEPLTGEGVLVAGTYKGKPFVVYDRNFDGTIDFGGISDGDRIYAFPEPDADPFLRAAYRAAMKK